MSTPFRFDEHLSAALFGKARRAILALLFGHPDESFYLRQVIRAAGTGQGAVQRELKRLSEAGVIKRVVRGRQVFYQANRQCAVFDELLGLVAKTIGAAEILRAALAPMADRVLIALIHGSFARGEQRQGSDVDLLVVGKVTFAEVVSALGPSQEKICREINPLVYPPAEFKKKMRLGHHLLQNIVGGPKIFLIGDDRDLARMAEKWLARGTQDTRSRDRRLITRGRP
jgi:DNA-binding transcriptional ArsR family regulator